MADLKSATKMNTGIVRASYVHLLKPRKQMDSNGNVTGEKYSVTLLVPKSDTKTYGDMKACINAAFEAEKGGKLKGIAKPKNPIHDGDGYKEDGSEFGPECKGHWVITASSVSKPGLIDKARNPITDESAVYSGMYICANVNFFAFAVPGNKGIGCGLNHVMKVRDGEPLAGIGDPRNAFEGVEFDDDDEDSVL